MSKLKTRELDRGKISPEDRLKRNREIGKRLRLVMTLLDVDYRNVAETVGVHYSQFYRLENGETSFSISYVIALHKRFADPASDEYQTLRKFNIYFTCDWFLTGKQALIED